MRIGTASITRSKTATAEAIFWQAIEAFVIRARTTPLDPRSKGRPGHVALARIKSGVPNQFSVTCPAMAQSQAQRAVSLGTIENLDQGQKSEGAGCNFGQLMGRSNDSEGNRSCSADRRRAGVRT